jgi:hypothetical protein
MADSDARHGGERFGFCREQHAQLKRDAQHPLTKGNRRQDMVNQVNRGVAGAARVAGRASAAKFAGER